MQENLEPHEEPISFNQDNSQEGVNIDPLCGKIIKVPKTLCDTEYIQIVAVNTEQNTQLQMRWELQARVYDPTLRMQVSRPFEVTRKEVNNWLSK